MKKSLVIGCDVDGTLTDLHSFYKTYGRKLYKKDVVNDSAYGLCEMFEISKKEEFKFGIKYFLKYCKDLSIRKNAVRILMEYKVNSAKVHAITARKFVTDNNLLGVYSRKLIKKYAKKNSIYFDSYEFCSEKYASRDKYAACSKLGVDVMIEDLPEVALYLAENGVLVALIDTPYNKDVSHKNIVRCKNFKEVSEVIKSIDISLEMGEQFVSFEKEKISKLSKEKKENYFLKYKESLLNEHFDKNELVKGEKRYKILYYLILIFTLRPLLVKVKNKEKILYQDGLIVISNHLDSLDQFSIAYALNQKYLSGYAASTIKKSIRGRLANFTKSAIFIDRESKSSKKSGKHVFDKRVANGYSALVFPEGTRKNKYEKYKDLMLLDFKLGAFSSAQITGAPILPIAIYKKNEKSRKSTLIIGDLIFVSKSDDITIKAKEAEKIIINILKSEGENL